MSGFARRALVGLSWLWLCLATAQAQTITVAAEDDWAPYSSASANGSQPQGLSPDLVRAAFQTQGVEVRFLTVPFTRCLHYAKTGVVVACFNATITPSNRAQFHWHATPLFQEELAIFAPQESQNSGLTAKDLEDHSLGVTIGYTYPPDVLNNPRIHTVVAASDSDLVTMLLAGRVDYALLNTLPAYYRISMDPTLVGRIKPVGLIETNGVRVAFSLKHPDGKRLSTVFEKGLQAIQSDGSYERIMADFRRRINVPGLAPK